MKKIYFLAFLIFVLTPLVNIKASMMNLNGGPYIPTCSDNSYDIVWSDCVNNKQYSSFVKTKDCTGDYTPSAYRDCSNPVSPLPCVESSYVYGEWTPCVNNVSVRTAYYDIVNNGSCIAHPEFPVTKKVCNILPTCEESSFVYSNWSACLNSSALRTATKTKECAGDYIPTTQKNCQVIQLINNAPTPPILLIKEPGADLIFAKKQTGKILLQVESRGEAWYINPKNGKRYYMANGNEAFKIMRNFGVGITNSDLNKIKADRNYARKFSGKIYLKIEGKGEAYYIDFKGIAHYMKNGSTALGLMRELGLGTKNDDLNKIPKGEF